jgi:DNA-binding response OmpR family regulator
MNEYVLMCCNDPHLEHVRKLLLNSIGMQVEIAFNTEDMRLICERGNVGLAIVCHTLTETEQQQAVNSIKSQCEDVPILVLSAGEYSRGSLSACHTFDVTEGPAALLKTCKELSQSFVTRQ